MKIIDGKAIAARIREQIKLEVAKLQHPPNLTVIIVGENPASQTYVANKEKACTEVGITSTVRRYKEDICEAELIQIIRELNDDENVNGILVQLPLPKHMNEARVLESVSVSKDVDGFHTENAGALFLGGKGLFACTPLGCIELIKSTGESLVGKHAVVVGRSNTVGKPLAMMLLKENCTVTVAHSKTQDLASITRQADILCVAIGRKHFITGDMVKPGAIVIDVGINRVDGKLYGDVDFDAAFKVASYITPVPGGVGPMTVAMLLQNVLETSK